MPLVDLVPPGPSRPDAVNGCVAAVDLVGDGAWELVCLSPFGWFEGRLGADGRQRLILDGAHWHDGLAPGQTLDASGPATRIRFRDYDRRGIPEATVTTLDPARGDYLLRRTGFDTYVPVPFRSGQTFATCDIDLDGDLLPDAVYAFKDGFGADGQNENALYRIVTTDDGVVLEPYDPVPDGGTDRVGWFGSPEGSGAEPTPMGCHRIPWM